eukprot:XP_006595862.2 uncharacterized protein LOC102662071 isoform X2 [Glycine max]
MLLPQFAYPQLYPTQLPYTPNPVPSSSTSHAASQAYLTSTAQSPSQSRYPDSGASLRVTNMSQNIQQLTHFEGPDQITICNGQGLNVNSSAKSFKVGNADQNANQAVHTNRLENLKQLFSSPPFLKSSSSTVDKQDPFVIDIDDIQIDEPVVFSSPQKIDIDKRDKGKGTDRQKLLEEVSTDSKPKARTAEEIKAKYRKTGDASAATALARDKLVERQEKLQLQNGAQDFASMATELAKRMENRKWWQL